MYEGGVYISKVIDFTQPIYEVCNKDKDVIGIMKDLGFDKITDCTMLNTVGRFMTIKKGAAVKGISLDKIKQAFLDKGYIIKSMED